MGMLALQTHATASGFTWVLVAGAQVLVLAQRARLPTKPSPQPCCLFVSLFVCLVWFRSPEQCVNTRVREKEEGRR